MPATMIAIGDWRLGDDSTVGGLLCVSIECNHYIPNYFVVAVVPYTGRTDKLLQTIDQPADRPTDRPISGVHSGQRGATVLVFDTIDGSPSLELKQTLHTPLPLTAKLETLMPFSKGFIVAGGGINGYLGVYENMVRLGSWGKG